MQGVLPLRHEELLRALHQALAPIAEESLTRLEAEHGRNPLAPNAATSTEERQRLFRLGAAWGWALALGRLLKEHGSSWLRVEWLREPTVDGLLEGVRDDLRRYGLPDPIDDASYWGAARQQPAQDASMRPTPRGVWLGLRRAQQDGFFAHHAHDPVGKAILEIYFDGLLPVTAQRRPLVKQVDEF